MTARIGAYLACLVALLAPASLAGNIGLSWNNSPGASGYRLHYGPGPSNYTTTLDVGNVTQTTLSGLPNCADSYFAVTAYNSAGESAFSQEVVSWPRPSLGAGTPTSVKQGTQLTLSVSGNNLHPNADFYQPPLRSDSLPAPPPDPNDDFGVTIEGTSQVLCDRIDLVLTVGPMAQNDRPAAIGTFGLTVTNPSGLVAQVTDINEAQAPVLEVLVNPARFDINRQDAATTDRLDGKDKTWLERLFAVQEGDADFDHDYDFDGNGWVNGNDLSILGFCDPSTSCTSFLGACWNGSFWSLSACGPL